MYGDCGVCVVGKMEKDVGTAIRKSIVVSFLPCLVAFWGFHPHMVPHILTYFCCFWGGGGGGEKRSMQRCVVVNHDLIAENSMFSSDSQPTTAKLQQSRLPSLWSIF